MSQLHPGVALRMAAARVMSGVADEGRSLSDLLPAAQSRLPEVDAALLQEICFGTARHWYSLCTYLDQALERPLHRRQAIVRPLLLTGLYQIRYLRTPNHAVVHSCAEAARALGFAPLVGLVNAILRGADRASDEAWAIAEHDLAAQFEHPLWMIEKLRHNWPDRWQAILRANTERPPMSLRVNVAKTSRESYLDQLKNADIAAEPSALCANGIRLAHAVPVTRLPGFADGLISVQDEAAQWCVDLLAAQPGQRVLDACAAPGGKTCALLEACPTLEHVLALDIEERRLPRIHDNLTRLGLHADVRVADAVQPNAWWDGKPFERILLDAPCSASGVIRRHPDIKLLRKEGDIATLASLQLRLLTALWPLLAVGGRLLYATCSVFPQENARIIERFLRQQADAALLPTVGSSGIQTGYGVQLFPTIEGTDGFFYACLHKPDGVSR